jgi:hypothetical protein
MATKIEHKTLHIVCWYPVLTGSIKLLVTPGGGILAGIHGSLIVVVFLFVSGSRKSEFRKTGAGSRRIEMYERREGFRCTRETGHLPTHHGPDGGKRPLGDIQACVNSAAARVSSCNRSLPACTSKIRPTNCGGKAYARGSTRLTRTGSSMKCWGRHCKCQFRVLAKELGSRP